MRLRKEDAIAKRTDARRAKAKHMKKRIRQVETSESRPSLGAEMACFKKLVKHVVRQDVDKNQAVLFKAEEKQHHRRLKNLGILGRQLAIQANCEMDPVTTEIIEEAIYSQKKGGSAKQLKAYREHKRAGDAAGMIIMSKARLDYRSCPRWMRDESRKAARDE